MALVAAAACRRGGVQRRIAGGVLRVDVHAGVERQTDRGEGFGFADAFGRVFAVPA